jgi:hypothetical protein
MSMDGNGSEEAETRVSSSGAPNTVEFHGNIVSGDAISRRGGGLPAIAQKPKRKRKAKDFRVFEPSSRSMFTLHYTSEKPAKC